MERGAGVTANALFITGTQRSGTTLLEKLLGFQEGISILSQPFPLLFVEAKRAFLRSRGFDDPYPLGHLFLEQRYSSGALDAFLSGWRTTHPELEALFTAMRDYSGQYTKFRSGKLATAFAAITSEDDFAEVVAGLDRRLAPSSDARWYGSKESICEEYVPALLDRGFRCVIILRDPRDVVASLNHGRGQEYGGAIKPTLFNIRNWRKSVAFALALEGHPRFHWCRYEDLVADPLSELDRLVRAIDLENGSPVQIAEEIVEEGGIPWRGNSSFQTHHGVSRSSVARHRGVLPDSVAAMIEACCLPELRVLGYETATDEDQAMRIIESFRETYTITRLDMENDLATPENRAIEVRRLQELMRPELDPVPWFLFDRVAARLRESIRS
jgi:hypothetical protein